MDRNIGDVHCVKPFVRWLGEEDMSTSLMQNRSNTDRTLTILRQNPQRIQG